MDRVVLYPSVFTLVWCMINPFVRGSCFAFLDEKCVEPGLMYGMFDETPVGCVLGRKGLNPLTQKHNREGRKGSNPLTQP